MKPGDLVKVGFAEADYYGILLDLNPWAHGSNYKILFCDGEVLTYSQDSLDYEEITIEVVSEGR